MKTYPEMNRKIVGILRISDSPDCQYAADRIEELEAEVEKLRSLLAACVRANDQREYYDDKVWGPAAEAAGGEYCWILAGAADRRRVTEEHKTWDGSYPVRCRIVDVDGEPEILPGTVPRTPDESRPHIGKAGIAVECEDGNVKITLDEGTVLWGYECWWVPIEAAQEEGSEP